MLDQSIHIHSHTNTMKNMYSTKLITRSTTFIIPLGIILILLGIASIVLSAIDVANSESTIYYRRQNPNDTNSTILRSSLQLSALSDQSIWPTLGKGIWCGLLFLGIGVVSIIVYREKTLISIRILSLLAFISMIISVFLFLSAITVFQRYVIQGRSTEDPKKSTEQKEIVLNALLLVCGVLAFLVSLGLAIGALIAGNLCQLQSEDFDNVDSFSPQVPPSYSAPTYFD